MISRACHTALASTTKGFGSKRRGPLPVVPTSVDDLMGGRCRPLWM